MSDLFFTGDSGTNSGTNSGGGSSESGGFDWLNFAQTLLTLGNQSDPVVREGRRLETLHVLTARPGQPIAQIFGRMRIGGQIIWRGPVNEIISETGGDSDKGSQPSTPVSRNFHYTMSLAIGLCDGPISHIGRIWADGRLLDTARLSTQLYLGDAEQMPDPMIEADKGSGRAPAFRGLAYLVIHDFDLTSFGNRVPQLSFEVFRPLPDEAPTTRAVCLLPGASEFAYHPTPQIRILGASHAVGENITAHAAQSDWQVSMDQLQQAHPQCRRVALVVAWFGDDLRVDQCRIAPRIDNREKNTFPANWSVAHVNRDTATLVSYVNNRPAVGGTPSDEAVSEAIKDLHQRGFEVMFYPFIIMDIAADNSLPNPYGGSRQPAYPWRGRITCHPAPGQPNSPDGSSAMSDAVRNFVRGHELFSLRGMMLHYANLCRDAGGVEAFLLASELPGISRIRSAANQYPFADELVQLAGELRAILPTGKISYAADWTEYGAHSVNGDVGFPLDAFWSDDNCDFIGIDNYLPLADWRDGSSHLDAQAGALDITDPAYLQSNVRGGEYFDWFYRDTAARDGQVRTPITDDLNEPWVYRSKDIQGWWENQHRPRRQGRLQSATAWQPSSKPVWFTELGCPAVDKGANQPNVFPDRLSSEGGLPHFSTGVRDDHMQQAYLRAVTEFYGQATYNPQSPVYNGPMIDTGHIYFWAWDARPFPAFPYRMDVWTDGGNWHTGHWLNGRHASAPLAGLLRELVGDVAHRISHVSGAVDGFAIVGPSRRADAMAPLLQGFAIDALTGQPQLQLVGRIARAHETIRPEDIIDPDGVRRQFDHSALTRRFDVHYIDAEGDYGAAHVSARHRAGERPVARLNLPLAMTASVAEHLAERLLYEARSGHETLSLTLPPRYVHLEIGDIIDYDDARWRIESVTHGATIEMTARRHLTGLYTARQKSRPAAGHAPRIGRIALPSLQLVDVPLPARRYDTETEDSRPLLAAFARPWPGAVSVVLPGGRRQILHTPVLMGETQAPLRAGPVGRWDRGTSLLVKLYGGRLAGLPHNDVLAGANRLALKTAEGWEVIQFARAELLAEGQYRLTDLLRGQFGSDVAMVDLLPSEAAFVVLGTGLVPLSFTDIADDSLTLRYGVSNLPEDGYSWRQTVFHHSQRATTCLSPVHGRVRFPTGRAGDWQVSWIRRSRIGGHAFDAPDVPLGEPTELYRIRLLADGALRAEWQSETAQFTYSTGTRNAHRAASPAIDAWHMQIAQINGQGVAGAPLNIPLPQ